MNAAPTQEAIPHRAPGCAAAAPLRRRSGWRGLCTLLIAALLASIMQGLALAQDKPPATPAFAPQELEALVAPIALYPDTLLSQVLMASTYPMEVVLAARWLKANPKLSGEAAVQAVQDQPWDVSVKSLVAFPQILEPMHEKLEWTQKLGDAFLAQNQDVMDAVQRLRARAKDAGNLASNAQQQVVEQPAGASQPTVIRIEQANPQVVYVPTYNPTVVYGGWSYPSYPPYYWPPSPAWYPGGALVSGFAWGVGLAAAGAIFSDCDWGRGDVNINVNKAANIDRNFDRTKVQQTGGRWQHDAAHRQGVAYRDNATRERYGRAAPGAEQRDAYRGRDTAGADRSQARADTRQRAAETDRTTRGGDRAGLDDRSQARADGARRTAPDGGTARERAGTQAGAADRLSTDRQAMDRQASRDRQASMDRAGRDNAFQGVDRGAAAQRDFDRGRASARSAGFSGGGGARAGGGGRGGGFGGRR